MGYDSALSVRESGVTGPLGEKHNKKVRVLSKAKNRTMEVMRFIEEYAHEYGEKKRRRLWKEYRKMKTCANVLKFRYYYEIEQYSLLHVIFCGNKWLDSVCGLRWADKAVQKYRERYAEIEKQHPGYKKIHMTLTVQNGEDLGSTFKKLDDGLKNMSQRIRDARRKKTSTSVFRHIRGMIGTIEVKRGKGGFWHPHFHAFILADQYIPQEELSKEWKTITKDSEITWVSEVEGSERDFCETIGYSLKVSTMEVEDQIHAYFVLRGKAMLRSWGLFRNVEIPENLNDEEVQDQPYIDILYRYVYGEQAYKLETVRWDYERKEEEYETPATNWKMHEKWQGEAD